MVNTEFQGFRISPQQRRLWSLHSIETSSPYRVSASVLLEGHVDARILKEAVHQTVMWHEVLRTTLRPMAGMEFPVQVIEDETTDFECEITDLSSNKYQLNLCLPALCTDEAGLVVLVREIAFAYSVLLRDEHVDRDILQYADISEVLNDLLESEETAAGRTHWLQTAAVGPAELKLPLADYPRNGHGFLPQSSTVTFEPDVIKGIASTANANNMSTATFLQACWHLLLWKLTGEDEITVGTAFSGRVYEGLDAVPGLFARYLPISCQVHPRQRIGEVLDQIREAISAADEHQDYFDAERIAQRVSQQEDQPFFFPISFEFVEPAPAFAAGGLTWTVQQQESCTDRFVLKLRCVATAGGSLHTEFHYDGARFAPRSIDVIARSYHTLVADVLQKTVVGELSVLDDEQRRQLLVEFNDTARAFDPPYCLHEAIQEQSARTPDHVAVIFQQQHLTYSELDARTNQLAHRLAQHGVGPETLVCVLVERSIEMIVGLVGILKAGAAYLPLDPEQPAERLKLMIDDGRPVLLLTQEKFLPIVNAAGGDSIPVICLDRDWPSIATEPTSRIESGASPSNVAYVIYTSGSTGQPKGVAITHEAISNRLLWLQHRFPLNASDRVLQKTVYSFDASVWELFLPLMTGASVVMAAPGAQRDSAALVAAIKENSVTILQMVPSMLAVLVEEPGITECRSLRHVFSGGEALTETLQERFYERLSWAELINTYGPTEAAIDVSYHPCERGRKRNKVLIGRPINNMQLYLLDEHQQPVPIGTAGELYIGGVGLARGYWGRPELTAERFVPNGFSNEPGTRLYRTGDKVRYLNDGTIEYLGRLDHQVKIRGNRIELGEIEAVVRKQPAVRDVVIQARDDNGSGKRLVAYVVTSNSDESPEKLQQALRQKLPDYMVPRAFVMLDQFPRLPNGKVNLRALPEPDHTAHFEIGNYVAPRTPVEDIVADIWANALHVEKVGINDNFFELGGHSLLATQVISRIRQVFRIELPLRTLFDDATVAGFSRSVELARGGTSGVLAEPIKPVSRDAELPLSFSQQRLWFLDQLESGSAAYNVASAIRLEGDLDVEALRRSFDEILSRHEVLRTTFTTVNGHPVQVIGPSQPVSLQIVDLQDVADAERTSEMRRLMHEEVARPFDLSRGPLLRVMLLRLSEAEYVAVLTMHHIVSDGWSLGVLVREVSTLYQAFSRGEAALLSELPVQYADYAAWQRQWLQGEVLETQLDYWRQHLSDAPAVVELPVDHSRPTVQTFRGENYESKIDQSTASALRDLGRREAASQFMTLLAAFDVLVSRYTGQDHIVVGTDVANRNRQEVEGLIGYFANQLVLHADLSGNPTFRDLLARVREVTLGAYAHQDLPFDRLVEELRPERDASRTPLFQLKVVMQNAPLPPMELPGLRLSAEEIGGGTAKFDLTLFMEDTPEGVNCTWQYNSDLFAPRTIERFATQFAQVLDQVAREPDAQLRDLIAALDQREREERLQEKQKLQAANLAKFKTIKPQAVSMS